MTDVRRCPTCKGVAQAGVLGTMMDVAMVRQYVGQLKKLGCTDDALAGVKAWCDERYKQCTCPREGFGFAGGFG